MLFRHGRRCSLAHITYYRSLLLLLLFLRNHRRVRLRRHGRFNIRSSSGALVTIVVVVVLVASSITIARRR